MPETIMAFDFGAKRVGVAVGEATLRNASALTTIKVAPTQLFDQIDPLVKEWTPARFVVGRPSYADGSPNAMTARCERFARQLAGRFRIPAICVDERWTSAEAETALKTAGIGARKQKDVNDALAAQFILERYFESHP
jgi:putative holliday junction resolvase